MTPPSAPIALLPSAGSGSRARTAKPKQYEMIAGKPLVLHTLHALLAVKGLAGIDVVVSPDDSIMAALLDQQGVDKNRVRVRPCGGETRSQSVRAGLAALLADGHAPDGWVLVHDAARCLVSPQDIERLIHVCSADEVGGLLARPMSDTVKRISPKDAQGSHAAHDAHPRVAQTLDRQTLWQAQTPQMFRLGPLISAYDRAGSAVTDEASAMEACGHRPLLVESQGPNLKITYPEDFAWAEAWLSRSANKETP